MSSEKDPVLIDIEQGIGKKYEDLNCKTCFDGYFYPQYGAAPHDCNGWDKIGTLTVHDRDRWPANFEPDEESEGQCGVWHCPECSEFAKERRV